MPRLIQNGAGQENVILLQKLSEKKASANEKPFGLLDYLITQVIISYQIIVSIRLRRFSKLEKTSG